MTVGVDAGMRFVKICLLEDGEIRAFHTFEMNGNFRENYIAAWNNIIKPAMGSAKIKSITATGYGASLVPNASRKITTHKCLAAAAVHSARSAKTIIDAGGLFIRILKLNESGEPAGEFINEKCAAGSGRFLEITAEAMNISMDAVSKTALNSVSPFQITSSCAVFAESEVISRIGSGTPSEDILAGVIKSIAAKASAILENAGAEDPVYITGGLADIAAFIESVKNISGRNIEILPPDPRQASAFGAALTGRAAKSSLPRRLIEHFMMRRGHL